MSKKLRKKDYIGSWLYAAGRIFTLEAKMLGPNEIKQILATKSLEELRPLIARSSESKSDLETVIRQELKADLDLIAEISPEKEAYLFCINRYDAHNLKLVLKSILTRQKDEDWQSLNLSTSEKEDILAKTFAPSEIEAKLLLSYLGQGEVDKLPSWLAKAAKQAKQAYTQTKDIRSIDIALDQAMYDRLFFLAKELASPWLEDYLRLDLDLLNLETLLRSYSRSLSEKDYLAQVLEPTSDLYSVDNYQLDEAEFKAKLKEEGYSLQIEALEQQEMAVLSLLSDQRRMEQIRLGKSSGEKELVLSYYLAREMERKNLNIVLTCLRNKIDLSRASQLMRKCYNDWRL